MKISSEKRDKIAEQILNHLYMNSPKIYFTSQIAREIARDEEFTKRMLLELKKKKLVTEIKKNPEGVDYIRRSRWRLSDKAYNAFKKIS